jgi:hypothetical protein
MKYIIDIDALKDCLDLLNKSWSDDGVYGYVRLSDVNAMIDKFPKEKYDSQFYSHDNDNCQEEHVKRGHWLYWEGWCGNHDMRIEDAVCSECGYEHPTVRWEYGDPKGNAAYDTILHKLSGECPKCGALMEKE